MHSLVLVSLCDGFLQGVKGKDGLPGDIGETGEDVSCLFSTYAVFQLCFFHCIISLKCELPPLFPMSRVSEVVVET